MVAANCIDPVTVVIPAYNLDAYLQDAIESVLKQQYDGPLSIIVLDDGSTDQSLEVANRMAEKVTNLKVVTQANQGRAKTRNRMLELAETDLVAWLDGDDLAAPCWLADQIGYLHSHPECVAVGGQGYSMTASGNAIGPITHPLDSEEIDQRHLSGQANAFFQSCVLVRKSAVLRAGGYDERYPCAEDYSLWLRLAEIGKLANLPACHLCYRVHATSANWTLNIDQRTQGHAIQQEALKRRGLPVDGKVMDEIPPMKKDDWNRRLFWINIALKSGNPVSALQMLGPALKKHPVSLVMWLATLVSVADAIIFLGNRTARFVPGKSLQINLLPSLSFYRVGRGLVRARRRWRGGVDANK
ncbi:glycosyltransferase family 2 protein [Rubripirellula sp.]|nr:glycosyltransferase family 2 protein [Rubripirellula sp.]